MTMIITDLLLLLLLLLLFFTASVAMSPMNFRTAMYTYNLAMLIKIQY